jgi:hypothetical protein
LHGGRRNAAPPGALYHEPGAALGTQKREPPQRLALVILLCLKEI